MLAEDENPWQQVWAEAPGGGGGTSSNPVDTAHEAFWQIWCPKCRT